SGRTIETTLCVQAAADFADLFEVKDALEKKGKVYTQVRDEGLVLGYERDDFVRETIVTSSAEATFSDAGIEFRLTIPAHGEWQTCLEVTPHTETVSHVKYAHGDREPRPNMSLDLEHWIAGAPELEPSWDNLDHLYWRSLVDLAALRFYPGVPGLPDGASVPAAGLPWFMALFGRDSLMTSYQAVPFLPELAKTTLRVLARLQGTRVDAFR